ncbi:TspO/MBR family protein [Edaphobacillus lindanitolerans]|uniref:TspO and MBR related proteins n=1 Tax=Edaphobacillus lindanitolerans TaxID=550447 RepID=A0A1U7PTU5_9BACI|nr:TspO/MBR family protein [Edaphobacillus lindanitolerans]SIT93060.1 TspO and MBR related proteins [Edaphobacillus lindanitolerans]
MDLIKVNGKVDGKKLMQAIAVPVIGGTIVGLLTAKSSKDEFKRLEKPGFAPPQAAFPIAWTSLYTVMGVARYRAGQARREEGRAGSFTAYDIQLGLNFLWSFLFFKWRLRGTALVEMTVLLGAIILSMAELRREDKTAGVLMIPYVVWVAYALALNASIWEKNK